MSIFWILVYEGQFCLYTDKNVSAKKWSCPSVFSVSMNFNSFGDCPGKDYLLITSILLFTQSLKVNGLGILEIIVGQDRRKLRSQFMKESLTVQNGVAL